MNILVKFTLKNMKEKKFRLILILISVTLSTALFFASSAVGQNIVNLFSAQMRALVGDSDIRIASNGGDYFSSFFHTQTFDKYKEDTEYIVGGFFGGATYKSESEEDININLIGYSLEDLEKFNPVELIESLPDESFGGRQVIVGYPDAQKYGFKVGDTIKMNAFGQEDNRFVVYGIANPTGVFFIPQDNRPIWLCQKIQPVDYQVYRAK